MNEQNIEQITQSTNTIGNWSLQFLKNIGVGDQWISQINLVFLLAILVVLVFVLQHVTRVVLRGILSRMSKLPRMSFVKSLLKRKFPHYLAMIIPYSLVVGSIPIIFDGYPKTMAFVDKLVEIYLVLYLIWLIMSVINAFGDTLKRRARFRDKPIDSYIQVIRIFFYFVGFIVLFSILSGKNPLVLITGLGAMSAVLMLIFKDTILGFVASIQVSANDMVRIGDWVTMPKHDADGDVIQITLTTVKIRNFDKTITTIPPYSLVSDSFQNWRGMQDTGGRRLKRSIFVKQSSIRFITDEELSELEKIQLISDYVRERNQEITTYNRTADADKSLNINGRNLTNLGLFRQYVTNYLINHPGVNKEMMIMVRQLQPTSKGLPLELYFFTDTTVWTEYENIVSDVFDHVTASAKFFDLELFEDVSNSLYVSNLDARSV